MLLLRRRSVLLAVLATATLAVAAPGPAIRDFSTTSVSVDVPVPDRVPALPSAPLADANTGVAPADQVTVTVSRRDELIDDQTGFLVAARIVDIGFRFDIDPYSPDTQLFVNSVPVALGVSKITVETTMVASAAIADVLPPEILGLAFDIGLAVVDVSATQELLALAPADLVADPSAVMPAEDVARLPDVLQIRRITIRVHVAEINGIRVDQIDLVEQVMDVLAEGYVLRAEPSTLPASNDPKELAAINERRAAHRRACMSHHRVAALWSRLPRGTRVALVVFFASLLILVVFVALPLAAYVYWKEGREGYTRVTASEAGVAQAGRLPTIAESDEEDDQGAAAKDEKAWLRANEHYQVVTEHPAQ